MMGERVAPYRILRAVVRGSKLLNVMKQLFSSYCSSWGTRRWVRCTSGRLLSSRVGTCMKSWVGLAEWSSTSWSVTKSWEISISMVHE